jgi:hypothetical protein
MFQLSLDFLLTERKLFLLHFPYDFNEYIILKAHR